MEEETVDNASPLCRICFQTGDYNITSYQLQIGEDNYELIQILKDLSALETWDMDNVPTMICNNCAEELGKCYMFVQKLRKADDKIREMLDSNNIQDNTDGDNSEITEYELIECLDEKDSEQDAEEVVDEPEEVLSNSELTSNTHQETEKKGIKRKVNNKQANIVLTENVTNILSNAQKLLQHDQDDASENPQPPIKISKDTSDGNRFLITKFIPSQATYMPDSITEPVRDDLLVDPSTVNHVRMFDMAAVEVKASGKIELSEEDDDIFTENPNTVYMCQYCPRAFATSHHLIIHQRKSHVCQFCMKGFSKVSDLHKHTKETHNQFNCALCKKNFSSNSNLRQHMKRIHSVELPAHVSLLSFRKKESST